MLKPELHHFQRAAREVAKHGDNDTLPFDIDVVKRNRKLNHFARRRAK